jgi:pilus assembly protein CpaE
VRTSKILVLDRSEELAAQVRNVADDLRPRPEIVVCERVGAVADMLTEEGPFDVLIAGPSLGTRSGLSRLEVIHDELPGMSLVLALTNRPDAQLRDIVRTGAIDLVQLPADDDALLASIDRAITLAKAQRPAEPAAAPHAAIAPGTAGAPGRVFTISSAAGGCGKTFFATNLAYFLTHYTGKRACIVDLDLQFGEVSTALRLRPRYTIFDALQRDDTDEADLRAHIEEYTVTHETGLHVLAAPKDPTEADRISPPDVTRILEAIRSRFDYVIVDTPAALTEVVLAALDLSDELYVMATLDLPSVRNMGVFLNTLEKLKISADNVQLVMNKAEKDIGIDIDQVLKLFPQGFQSVLPYAREVSKSINVGTPVIAFMPNTDVSKKLRSGLMSLLPDDARARAEAGAPRERRGLFRRKAKQAIAPARP